MTSPGWSVEDDMTSPKQLSQKPLFVNNRGRFLLYHHWTPTTPSITPSDGQWRNVSVSWGFVHLIPHASKHLFGSIIITVLENRKSWVLHANHLTRLVESFCMLDYILLKSRYYFLELFVSLDTILFMVFHFHALKS